MPKPSTQLQIPPPVLFVVSCLALQWVRWKRPVVRPIFDHFLLLQNARCFWVKSGLNPAIEHSGCCGNTLLAGGNRYASVTIDTPITNSVIRAPLVWPTATCRPRIGRFAPTGAGNRAGLETGFALGLVLMCSWVTPVVGVVQCITVNSLLTSDTALQHCEVLPELLLFRQEPLLALGPVWPGT